MALTEKQKRFVAEYLVDLNATAAAKRAGYKDPNIGRQLITKNNVSAAIQNAMQERQERTGITQDLVLAELAKIAFVDRGAFARVAGGGRTVEITDTDSLTADQRAVLASVEETKFGVKVSTYDKLRALELLGKHLGLFDGKGAKSESRENNLLEALKETEEIDTDDLDEVE